MKPSFAPLLFSLFWCVFVQSEAMAQVRVNEVMASNSDTIADEDGEFSDWIELFNAGSEAVDLSNWGLSDSLSNRFKWRFPSGASIGAEEDLLVWASGKDRGPNPLFAPSELAPAIWLRGDSVLTRSEGGSEFVEQWTDLSGHGRHANQIDELRQPQMSELSGLPAVHFDGVRQMLAFSGDTLDLFRREFAGSIFAVVVPETTSGTRTIVSFSAGNTSVVRFALKTAGGNVRASGRRLHGDAGRVASGPLGALNEAKVLGAVSRWDDRSLVLLQDGRITASALYAGGGGRSSETASAQAFVGANPGFVHFFRGRIAEILVFDRQLSPSERSQIHWYLVNRYGLETELSLHTNYSLSQAGESVVLTAPDAATVDQFPPVEIPHGTSFGRDPENPENLVYFSEPSPRTENGGPRFVGLLQRPSFSHAPGFFTNPFELFLSAEPETTILYTLDGSVPDPANLGGTTFLFKNDFPVTPGSLPGPFLEETLESRVFSGGILISDRSSEPNRVSAKSTTAVHAPAPYLPTEPVFKGTVVRARAFRDGYLDSRVATGTFFVTPTGSARIPLTVVSLSTDESNLFDYDVGIYTAGARFDAWRLANPQATFNANNRNIPRNYNRSTPEWERPASIELMNTSDGYLQQEIGIRIHGAASRGRDQKSFRLLARGRYDLAGSFDYPIFGNLAARGAPSRLLSNFDRALLRNGGNDFDHTTARDAFLQSLVSELRLDHQAYRPTAHLRLAGPMRVIFSGKLEDQHGIAALLGAIQLLDEHKIVERFRFDVCGRGPRSRDLEAYAANARPELVRFHGFTSDADYRELLDQADVGLALQDPEGFYGTTKTPSKAFEFICHGKILVASDVGDLSKLPREFCHLCKPVCAYALFEILRNLATMDDAAIVQARRSASEHALIHYSQEVAGRNLVAFFDRLRGI
jgi:glycosyltransferase involved in cell wall biosynthesis